MPRPTRNVFLFGLLATLWGGSFVAIKFVVAAVPPAFGAMLRVGVALAALAAYFRYEAKSLTVPKNVRRRMWLAGLFAQGLPFAALFWGERRISPGLAGIINGTVPLFAFVFGLLIGHNEALTRRRMAGLVLGFTGTAVICSPLLSFNGSRDEILGTGAVFLMAMFYAAGSLMTRSLLSGSANADFRSNSFHQTSAAFAFLVVWSFLTEGRIDLAAFFNSPSAMISVAYLGLFSTALAFLIYFHLIREWGAVRASAVTYVAPVVAVFWDYVFFRNVPRVTEFAGMIAVLSGVILLNPPRSRPTA